MQVLSGGLFGLGLLLALCVQSNLTPLAGAWLLPIMACCGIMLATQERKQHDSVWYCSLAWLAVIGLSTFFIRPVTNGAATGWVLAAAPLVAVTAGPKYLKALLTASACIIVLYSLCLIAQAGLLVHYTHFGYPSRSFHWDRPAWPLIDPNNAACIMVAGLLGFAYARAKGQSSLWIAPTMLCGIALLLTESKAAVLAAIISGTILLLRGRIAVLLCILGMIIGAWAIALFWDSMLFLLIKDMQIRYTLWHDAWPLLWARPYTGIGLGNFANYYPLIRHETKTAGFFAHNDLYQMAIEMGIPSILPVLALIAAVLVSSSRQRIGGACVFLAVLLMSMLEFQLYLPSISLLLGLALAYIINHPTQKAYL